MFKRRWNWWPPFIISVIMRRIMAAKIALLVEPLAFSILEKTESFSIAADWNFDAKGASLGRWNRSWFAEAANVADRTRSSEQASGSKRVLKPFEAPSTATSVGAIFSETAPCVRSVHTICYIRQYIQLKKSSLVKGSKSSRLGGIEVDVKALESKKKEKSAMRYGKCGIIRIQTKMQHSQKTSLPKTPSMMQGSVAPG